MENSLKGGISMEFKYTINNDGELDFIIEEIKDETETSSLNDEDKKSEESKEKIDSIVKLQSFWRGKISRKQYNDLKKKKKRFSEYFNQQDRYETLSSLAFDFSAPPDILPIYTYKSGSTYEGVWRGGFRDGLGTQVWPNGASYSGEWSFGFAHGKGEFKYESGATYEGQWANSYQHGNGIIKESNGCIYDGEFYEGNRHGFCIYIENDSQYFGQCSEQKVSGLGVKIYRNGESYKGEWKKYKHEGYGILDSADGEKFIGMHKDGSKHGFGVQSNNILRYEGLFFQDRMQGIGKIIAPSEGKIVYCVVKEDEMKKIIEKENINNYVDLYFEEGITLDNYEVIRNQDENLKSSDVKMYLHDSTQLQKIVESVADKVDNLLSMHEASVSKYKDFYIDSTE